MSYRLKLVACFFIFSQFLMSSLTHAQNETHQTSQINASINTTTAIEQFVRGDFNIRRQLLNNWPASTQELEQLSTYIENEQLFTDHSGQTYILENNETLKRLSDQQVISNWPADLNQITLVNTLKKALTFGLAKRKLNSDQTQERLEAIDILEMNLSELDKNQINQLYLDEKNQKVKDRFAQLKARLDYQSSDLLVKIQAVQVLSKNYI